MPSLLIVGGLTIDRFADGRSSPGGSVLHAGLAAASEADAMTMLTAAGDEPEARDGISRLRALGDVRWQRASHTTTYRHDESTGHRILVYERAGELIRLDDTEPLPAIDVALLAPIADELPPPTVDLLRARVRPALVVLLMQGWLRRLAIGEPVRPLALDEVTPAWWRTFGTADAAVLSTEDLADGRADPFAQAAAVRERIGPGPLLVLTLGTDGYLLDDPAEERVVASVPRTIIRDVPTVGAGDTFGAALALRLAAGDRPAEAAEAGSERVIEVLESRR